MSFKEFISTRDEEEIKNMLSRHRKLMAKFKSVAKIVGTLSRLRNKRPEDRRLQVNEKLLLSTQQKNKELEDKLVEIETIRKKLETDIKMIQTHFNVSTISELLKAKVKILNLTSKRKSGTSDNDFGRRPSFAPRSSQLRLRGENQKEKLEGQCMTMIEETRQRTSKIKKSEQISINSLMKHVSCIYKELLTLDDTTIIKMNFPNYVYDYFIKIFGLYKSTDMKFQQFLLTLKKHQQAIRVAVFCKFMQLYEFANYKPGELLVSEC